MADPDYIYESESLRPVCGVDEVGRGPWAGPVVAAAVILDPAQIPSGLNDSKKLSAKRREVLFEEIMLVAHVGVGMASVGEVDDINILNATYLAMRRAMADLPVVPKYALIDGNRLPPDMMCDGKTIIKGDARSVSIAAASIIAKVTRDRIMVTLSQQFPGYGWEKNAGYGVPAHIEGLKRLGVTPHHRVSFKPIHKMLYQEN